MVIACPNCKRKYQIDTTRIPAGGTSFTCWSCRAGVRVDPLAGLGRSSAGEEAGGAALARPRLDETAPAAPPATSTGPTTVPPAAMRFFESLAAEASLNKQMNAPESNGETEATAATAAVVPEAQPAAAAPEPPPAAAVAPEPPPAVAEPVRHVGQTLDLLTGNDVLDLPHLEPIVPAAPVEDVLELDLGIPEPPPREETLEFAPVATAPAEPVEAPMRTQALASAPPELPSVAPRPRPVPTPIPLPSQYQELAATAAPEPPAAETPEPKPEPVRFRPQPIAPAPPPPPPPAPEPTPFVPPPPPAPAFEPPVAVAPVRQSPSEFAAANPTAWISPEVEPKISTSGSRLGMLALAALLVVGLSAFLVWRFLLRDVLAPTTPAAQTQTTPVPAPQPAGQSPAAPTQTPAPDSKAPAPTAPVTTPPAPAPTTAPTGSGGFTIQVRSSPSEADARAFADTLKAGGFDAYVVRADLGSRGTWYRVRVGRFDSRDAARQAVGKLRSSGRANEAIVQAYEAP